MAHWKLDPNGVYDVLTKVGGEVEDIGSDIAQDKIESLATAVVGGDTKSAFSYVAQSASDLIEDQLANVTTIQVRMNAGVLGVANAMAAYCQGQYDMQDTYNKEMLKTADTGNFDFFKTHSHLPKEK